ncbi:pilus assembly protein [Roseovarius faecimaris]|uniref:Pilus assembly protein n=1 Tax=Roseovarius faecimaris TaxID=2494550 RepID=A0A6I6IU77_9RHOB|nr:TadE family protein [Roseovarius faecimaris]QGX99047.1 pilus assembly protein [Roseovarius faecimaris]
MIRAFFSRLRRGFRDEEGSAAVEFVIIFPVIATMIVLTLEMGFITLRQTMLERGLDMAVREVRLGTGSAPEHDDIKDLICQNSLILSDCSNNLFLEMVPSDPRAFAGLHELTSCTDAAVPSRPVRSFTPGQQNQLVMLRACVLYDPLFPEALLPRVLTADDFGKSAIIAVTAFVQEPV